MATRNDSHQVILTSFEDEYEETHDPVWVWHGIDFCSSWQRKTGEELPYPRWIRDYLSMVAEAFLKLDDGRNDLPDRITEVIGIKHNSISASIKTIRDKVIYFEIQSQIKAGRQSGEAISSIAKALALPEDEVREIYQKFRR